jgi:hypothetical protein
MDNKSKEKIRSFLFEENWPKYGSEYMSHPKDQETTVPPNLPVVPADLMPNQLAVERPPIEDDEFVPDGVEELSRAVAVIAQQVPATEVAFFYKQAKNVLEKAISQSNDPEIVTPEKEDREAIEAELDSAEASGEVAESALIKYMRKVMINEISDWSGIKLGRQYDLDEPEDLEPAATVKDTIKGKHIAPYYNKAGPSGVNVSSDRLMQQIMKPLFDVPDSEIKDATDYLVYQFRENSPELPNQKEAERAFVGFFFKKVVRKLTRKDESSLKDRFLTGIVERWKSLNDKQVKELVTNAVEEAFSELEDRQKCIDNLSTEEPEQFELLQDLGLA